MLVLGSGKDSFTNSRTVSPVQVGRISPSFAVHYKLSLVILGQLDQFNPDDRHSLYALLLGDVLRIPWDENRHETNHQFGESL